MRGRFQGTSNIIRFNYHYYIVAGIVITLLCLLLHPFPSFRGYIAVIISCIIATIGFSLLVSFYIYDFSPLYKFDWLNTLFTVKPKRILNINAGFDESSSLLTGRFPESDMTVIDFFDPKRQTEFSIRRARRAYPAFPGTIMINSRHFHHFECRQDLILLLFAAHEIRKEDEAIRFFQLIRGNLSKGGKVAVMEHLRDLPNFFAYNIGFLHFYSRNRWLRIFSKAGLSVEREIKVNLFVRLFILIDYDTTS